MKNLLKNCLVLRCHNYGYKNKDSLLLDTDDKFILPAAKKSLPYKILIY